MGRHYRSPQRPFKIFARLVLLAVLAAALAFVLCRLYPDNVILFKSHEIAAVIKAKMTIKNLNGNIKNVQGKILSEDTFVSADKSSADQSAADIKANKKTELAIVIDDGGNNIDLAKRVAALNFPMTWAILPYERFSKATASIADEHKIPYLLHMPMQAETDKDGGPYLIGCGMDKENIRTITSMALNSMPGASGISNHRGSLATSDSKVMQPVMDELKKRKLVFLDSRTSAKSIAYDTAVKEGVRAFQNKGFLDGTPDKDAIEAKFNEAVKYAIKKKQGRMILICHFRPATVLFLEKLNRGYAGLPVSFVTLPVMDKRDKEAANGEDGK